MNAPINTLGACPAPRPHNQTVLLGHGGGGRLMNQLIERVFRAAFSSPELERRHDGACLDLDGARIAFTTDSFVVSPLFFPGGDIGRLAVHGTVNDLAMCGAAPRYLSAGFIIEEGLAMETLTRIAASMQAAAAEVGVTFVTGDTKVVDRGKGDGVFINTAGIGLLPRGRQVGPERVAAGDVVILSGDVGRHGIAIMAQREGLQFESPVMSDCADLSAMVADLFAAGFDVHCLRDCTRGGVGAALVEIAETAAVGLRVRERDVPVCDEVRGACEILGLDPVFVANEGRFIAMAPAREAPAIVETLRRHADGAGACIVGDVIAAHPGEVTLESLIGSDRVMDLFSGEQLPRIC